MSIRLIALGLVAASLAVFASAARSPAAAPANPKSVLDFTMQDIDGKDVPLSQYKGKVLLILNVASKCGNTPQYAALEATYAKYKDKGLVIMGFPANNFGGQEPGTDAQIKEFCTATYQVAFPMFHKVSVKTDKTNGEIDPLFKFLTTQESKPLSKGDIAWNFEKFLIAKDGTLVARFANKTKPDDQSIISAIEAELAKQ